MICWERGRTGTKGYLSRIRELRLFVSVVSIKVEYLDPVNS